MNYKYEQISRMNDQSLLMPSLTFVDFEAGCRMAVAYQADSVCIQPQ
jgi:deoxyribose-phosphate aldolase